MRPTDRSAPTAIELSLDTLVPDNPNKPYDMKELILKVVDEGDFFELQPDYAQQHRHRLRAAWRAAPSASSPTSRWCWPAASTSTQPIKAARFVRFCDAFNIPIVTFVDVPGFLPGTAQEYGGIIKHGAKLLYRLRRGDGAQGHGHHPQGLWRRLRRDELQAPARRRELRLAVGRDRGDGAEGRGGDHLPRATSATPDKIAARTEEYREKFANPFVAGHRGFIDDVIMPHDTRKRICRALAMLRDKKLENPWRKHGNIPL